ncbi:MAG: preprotein translocase subunit SecE [Candidatus Onthovivens sp.]|nr:preprotein translocase subunit SecE [Mollicutes bacterium]MDY4936756.1 preprotein translocase subunit SecE [Candidatus Onthovivens sp.]
MKGNPITYFRGVAREAKRVRWPKREAFLPAIGVVIAITVFAAIFLVLEDLAAGTLIEQLQKAFELM